MKHLHFITLFIIAAVFMSCGRDSSFKIDGELVHVNGAAVRVVFNGDSGIVDKWVDVDKKGHFTFKGETSQLTIVNLLDHSDKLIANMVAVNGDHLKVKGDAAVAMSVKVKGNKVNEDWQLFRNEHAAFYTDPNPSRLNAAIEKFVLEHATDVLSTVLLVADYSDYSDIEKVENLLKGIDLLAKPESLTADLDLKAGRKHNSLPRLMTLTLVKHGGTFEEIKLTGKYSLINMWVNPQKARETTIGQLQDLDKGVQVIDVLAEGDTLNWHQTIGGDPKQWKHYWAPGGPIEQGIQLLGVTSMPWYAVTDSTGLVVYSGTSLSSALKAIAQ